MTLAADDLYALLPAMLRTADAASGGALQALIGIIAEQAGVLDDNMRAFYADQFIETCAPWTVPYIGDLIGWGGLIEGDPSAGASRAEVANTIGYRRRKGTVIALEQIARDLTGRPTRIVEFFRRLATTQSLHHLRRDHASFPDLRHGELLERFGTAFDTTNRSVDVRRIGPRAGGPASGNPAPMASALHGEGRFNIPDLGAFVWRWKPYQVTKQAAFAVDARRFMFSPLGQNMALFNAVPVRPSFSALTTRMDVPQPITRREFAASPAAFYGEAPAIGASGIAVPASLAVYAGGRFVPLANISVCNLADTADGTWAPGRAGLVAIDPVLGRIAFPPDQPAPRSVAVDYNYGFPADLGGGPYSRVDALPANATWRVTVGVDVAGLAQAAAAFNAQPAGTNGLILLPGFATFATTGALIRIRSGSTLAIVSVHAAAPLPAAEQSRATLFGDIAIQGIAGGNAAAEPPSVTFSGVLMAGTITVASASGGPPVTLALGDCTLVPGRGLLRAGEPAEPDAPSIVVASAGSAVQLDHSIVGPLYVHAAASARVTSCFVDATSPYAVAFAGPDGAGEGGTLQAEEATIIGKVRTHLMQLASNTIFMAARGAADPWAASVWCTRRQSGCIRFSALPSDALTPGSYRCTLFDAPGATLAPQFVTLAYGQPSYGLPSGACPIAIWQGADDEAEIGAYHDLYEPQAVANLASRLAEYTPVALESGIFLIPSRTEALAPSGLPYGYSPSLAELDTLEAQAIGLALL